MKLLFFLLTMRALALYLVFPGKIGLACRYSCRIRHAHYLLGYAVGFLLVTVTGLVDGKFGLQNRPRARHHAQRRLIADRGLQ
jgi:hypothetical protein